MESPHLPMAISTWNKPPERRLMWGSEQWWRRVFWMSPTRDCPVPGAWQSRVEQFLSACPRNSLISPALFCHSAYLCSPDTFLAAEKICSEKGFLLFTHVAETEWEVDEISRKYGSRPIEHLSKIGILKKGLVAVHAIHLTDDEKQLLASIRRCHGPLS